jgi:hypothetical protein
VPFIIWIKDGKLLSTTDATQLTEETINEILMESNLLCRPLSKWTETSLDAFEDYDRQKNIQLLNYSFFAKGPIPDIGSGGTFRTTPSGTINGRQFTNLPLWDMYYAIGFELFKQQSQESFTGKRMLIEVKDPKS